MTIDEMINELESIKRKIGGDKDVSILYSNGLQVSRIESVQYDEEYLDMVYIVETK